MEKRVLCERPLCDIYHGDISLCILTGKNLICQIGCSELNYRSQTMILKMNVYPVTNSYSLEHLFKT